MRRWVTLFAKTDQNLLKLCHHWRSKPPWKQDWNIETEIPVMKTKYTMFRRGEVFYLQDTATGKQTSLRTKDETEAKSLLNARNEAQRQPRCKWRRLINGRWGQHDHSVARSQNGYSFLVFCC